MGKLQNVLKTVSVLLIIFGLISFAYSAFSDLLTLFNKDSGYDVMSSITHDMLPFINGGAFICIGGILQVITGVFGIRASYDSDTVFRPIMLSIITIAWLITGFIILFTMKILNVRLIIQLLITIAFIVVALVIKFKTSQAGGKKSINKNIINDLGILDQKVKKRDITSLFKFNYRQKRVHNVFTGKRRVKRINIKPTRKFKR